LINAREPFAVGDWTVDPATGTLSGPTGPKRLTPKLTDLLVALAQRAGQVATRDELLREVWGERGAVSDEPLTRAVAELRRMLGDDRGDPAYIATIPKRGYRVVAPVTAIAPAAKAAAIAPVAPAAVPVAAPVAPAAAQTAPATAAPTAPALPPALSVPAAAIAAAPPIAAAARASALRWVLAALAATALAAVGLIAIFALRDPAPARPAGPISVAVLPFADLSPAADRQYFADGVHEEVIARLAGVAGLRVAARSTVDAYRDAGRPAVDVARELGVGALIEGTVRYADERVRVTARLIDPASDTHLWAETFDRPLTLENLFDIQADIAERVTAGLTRSLAVGGVESAAPLPTANLAAYEAFLLGKYHYRRHQPGDIRIAIEQFQIAVDADPVFADAWDWLAYAWNEAGVDLGWTTPARAFPRARAAALRALELDSGLATSSALLGFLRATYDWEWEAALTELERAVAAAPEETGTVWSYAFVLSLQGRHDEAIDRVQALADAFPEDGRLDQQLAGRLIDAGRYAAAVEAANAALDGGAEQGQVHEILGIAAFGAGDLPRAVAELERAVALQQGAAPAVGRLAALYAHAGRHDEARALLAELEARGSSEQLNVATLARVHVALGERDRAFALLERGVEQRQRDVLGIAIDPFFAALRDDARFASLVERMGVAAPRRSSG
jgi:TolB-like protein/DNA-binding winged helix-turn-helix (wHTH) protein/Tfp pilus assembly protein PilF